jgi:hypothetical protein
MGVIRNNRTNIVAGGLISASYVSDVYDVLTANAVEDVVLSGSLGVSGSLTANLTGTADTASYVTLAQTASYVENAQTASYIANAVSASYISGSHVITTSGSIQYLEVTSKFISEGTAFIYTASLPATDPSVNGQLWRSGSYLMISTGSGS